MVEDTSLDQLGHNVTAVITIVHAEINSFMIQSTSNIQSFYFQTAGQEVKYWTSEEYFRRVFS